MYSYGNPNDYDVSKSTDQMLINLHQDWLLARQQFGTSKRTDKMITSIEEEMKCRKLSPEEYGWVSPRQYESTIASAK